MTEAHDPLDGMSDDELMATGWGIVERNERRLAALLSKIDHDPPAEFVRRDALLGAVLVRDWDAARHLIVGRAPTSEAA